MVLYVQTLTEWSRIYVRYIGVYRKLEDSFDQVLQIELILCIRIYIYIYMGISINVNESPFPLTLVMFYQALK